MSVPISMQLDRAVHRRVDEAKRTLALGAGHVDPDDLTYATRVHCFDFAMGVHRLGDQLRLDRT